MANKFMKRDSISFISHQGNTNKNKRNSTCPIKSLKLNSLTILNVGKDGEQMKLSGCGGREWGEGV